jgi:hypothetical protein
MQNPKVCKRLAMMMSILPEDEARIEREKASATLRP